ncbi:MAG: trypsin-like peptidase domain-containing protein [Hyphomicrobium sp.]
MRRLSAAAAVSDAEVDQLRANKERDADDERALESLGPGSPESLGLSDAEVAALISPEARDVVVGFEVGSRKDYERKYISPEWPKGDSGVTIGIGYDIGYHTADELTRNWGGLISDADIQRLKIAVGVKGARAGAICPSVAEIRVPWDAAIAAYERSTMPKYGRLVLRAFPQAVELNGHCFGALFSLVFNRGASLEGERRREMRAIRDHIAARSFKNVPDDIREMKRLWEGQGLPGLLKRRDAEALLFARGLETMMVASASGGASQQESLEDESLFDGDGRFADEDEADGLARESGQIWEEVKWPANDDEAPDYRHIAELAFSGKTFELDGRGLELLIKANAFEPDRGQGRIIFALRGAELVTSLSNPEFMMRQQDRASLTLRDCRPNHKDFRCVIGVYDLTTSRMSGFASSTAPNRGAVAQYYSNQTAGNMMPTGCYRFEVGWHLVSKPERKIPGCLVERGRRKCVHRSVNNLSYDIEDKWENHQDHGDNLHPAKSAASAKFSSLGCLVVSGGYECGADRERGTHTGEWALFRKALGLTKPGTGDHRREFDVVLLTGLEAAAANDLVARGSDGDDQLVQRLLGRIRQGSKGERVKRLQRGLSLTETGTFSHDVVKAWTDRQRADFGGKSVGVFSPSSDVHYNFGVFDPLPVAVASSDGAARVESLGEYAPGRLEGLYYDIGLHAEAARRNPSADSSSLESLGDANLEAINLEYGVEKLKAYGLSLVRTAETKLQEAICGDPLGVVADRDDLRSQVNSAAQKGLGELQRYLAGWLSTATVFMPPSISEKIVQALFERILRPAAGEVGGAVVRGVDLSAQWLCQQWCGSQASPKAAPAPAVAAPAAGVTTVADAATTPLQDSKISDLLAQIEKAAHGSPPDTAVVRQSIRDLRQHVGESGGRIGASDATRLLDLMSASTLTEPASSATGVDPYGVIHEIETALDPKKLDKETARKRIGELHALLGDARMRLKPDVVKGLLKAVRGAKMFDELSWLADRFAARDPELLGVVTTSYAQGLIDSGRLVSGIEMLHAAEDLNIFEDADRIDAAGILGRGHKQIYVNHVKTPSDAVVLRERFGGQLDKAIESYGRNVDPQRPSENFYHGVNYLALLKRAERDGVKVTAKAEANSLARGMIAAMEPHLTASTDPWFVASLGEAYLALRYYGKAAECMARYANMANAFELNSTVRQLEEVWQIKSAAEGAGAILTNLKAALAQKDNGFVSLAPEERKLIAKAESVEFQQVFESATPGGKFVNFGLLKMIVERGAAVAAIQMRLGQSGRTMGTGFLVRGPDFSPSLSADRSYVLTNAHVLWDRTGDQGLEDKALAPDVARIIFENDEIDGRSDVYDCAKVVWQSPSSLHDATLVELNRRVDHVEPLELAPANYPLTVTEDISKSSRLAVLGHPQGGHLAIGILGSLDEMKGTLVDKGPRVNCTDPVFLHYETPTEPGNSGSPVFEADTWRVVALHHAGFVEGKGGLAKLAGKSGTNLANEGIYIESIRAAVRAKLDPPPPPSQKRRKWFG